jgi:hypothetical protein
MRYITAVSLFFLSAGTIASASFAPPPEAPAGWEANQTPGFDPSVESVLVERSREIPPLFFTADSARPFWDKWGPAAREVLFRLLAAPEWERFQYWIGSLLVACPFPEVREQVEAELYRLAEGPELTQADQKKFQKRLSHSPHPAVLATVIRELSWTLTEESLAAAREAVDRLPPKDRRRVLADVDHGYAQLRAREPMAQAPVIELARPMPKGGGKTLSRKEIKALQDRFLKSPEPNNDAANALIELAQQPRSKGIVEYFADIASTPELHAVMRQNALFALGRIGTKDSVAKWKSLRDAARAQPGAPQPRPAYTHAQRMYEAAVFAICIIPGAANPYHQLSNPGAWVSADYKRGAVLLGDVDVQLLRYGDEWMSVEEQPLPVP